MPDLARFFSALDALPADQLAGAFPVVLVMFAPLLGELPPPLADRIADFERSLALPPDADDATKKAAFDKHLRAHGITSSLWRDLLAALQGASPSDVQAAAQKLVGAASAKGVLQRTAPPPAGTVGAGPFARFAATGALADAVAKKNDAALVAGRLLTIQVDAGYNTVADVDAMIAAIGRELAHLPAGKRAVIAADWRGCKLMRPDAASRALTMFTSNNPRIERSCVLSSPSSPTAVLQFMRLVRDAAHAERRVVSQPAEAAEFLRPILDDAERAALDTFLARKPQ